MYNHISSFTAEASNLNTFPPAPSEMYLEVIVHVLLCARRIVCLRGVRFNVHSSHSSQPGCAGRSCIHRLRILCQSFCSPSIASLEPGEVLRCEKWCGSQRTVRHGGLDRVHTVHDDKTCFAQHQSHDSSSYPLPESQIIAQSVRSGGHTGGVERPHRAACRRVSRVSAKLPGIRL